MRTYLALALLAASCSHPSPPPAAKAAALTAATKAEYTVMVASPDRTEEDRKLDAGRHPVEMLEFLAIKPGMKVAEVFAGGGYTTELLARAVGPTGTVYGQNTPMILQRFAEKPWSARLARPVNARVVRVDREVESPL